MNRFLPLICLLGLMWLGFFMSVQDGSALLRFGIVPRDLDGLRGILFWPFLHGNLSHISNNTLSVAVLGAIVSLRGGRTFLALTIYLTLMAGFGVWVVGRPAVHIGASGLSFGYFGYIVLRSFHDRSLFSVVLAVIVIVAFGGIIWGVLPSKSYVSWEAHLCGLLAGAAFSRYYRKRSSPLRI